ncbi:hypothetical protein L1887_41884 [Cichorium endivia]|nr:hypothetical protein L1887_41884 [Cichorium endivia]
MKRTITRSGKVYKWQLLWSEQLIDIVAQRLDRMCGQGESLTLEHDESLMGSLYIIWKESDFVKQSLLYHQFL